MRRMADAIMADVRPATASRDSDITKLTVRAQSRLIREFNKPACSDLARPPKRNKHLSRTLDESLQPDSISATAHKQQSRIAPT